MSGPLTGVRVIDAATMLAAPLAAQILGDFGADVIKVEHPTRPDAVRGHGVHVNGHSLWWKQVSRNKRSVTINLSKPAGAELLLKLVAQADVLITNYRPGTLEKWGLGWSEIRKANPDIIQLKVSGFGQTGPYSGRAAFGTVTEAMSGFAAVTGEPDGPPTLPPFGLADYIAGVSGAGAVAMALYERERNGQGGQEIDQSLLLPIMGATGIGPAIFQATGQLQKRLGNFGDGGTAPRNVYPTADGKWVALSASAHNIAERVMRLVGHPEVLDEPWFSTNAGRWDHVDEVDSYVGSWISLRSQAEVVEAFSEAGAAVGPVYTAEDILADPQITETEMIVQFDDPDVGRVAQTAPLFGMSRTPGAIRFLGTSYSSAAEEVLQGELGLAPEDLEKLRADGVIA